MEYGVEESPEDGFADVCLFPAGEPPDFFQNAIMLRHHPLAPMWARHICLYSSLSFKSCACVPLAATRPPSMTKMRSASVMVERRWGDHDHRLALHQFRHGALDDGLVLGVDVGGGLIEDDDGRVLQHGAGDGNALPLTAGEVRPAAAHLRVVAVFLARIKASQPAARATASTSASLASSRPMRMFSRTVSSKR